MTNQFFPWYEKYFSIFKTTILSENIGYLSILTISYNKYSNISTLSLCTLSTRSSAMTISRIYVMTLLTATIVIAATAALTMTPIPAAATQHTIHIIKDATNSYTISGSSSHVGSFDTTYRIAGERSSIRSAENLIISTITRDFTTSPTVGYVTAGGGTGATGTEAGAGRPSPFASHQQITERIASELRSAITQAESNTSQGQHVEIKCDFGTSLESMRCQHGPLPQTR